MPSLFRHRTDMGLWEGSGRVVTVWGPTGSPGRSMLAAALAGALAPTGRVALDPADLTALLARLRLSFDLVLVDVGAALPPREFGDAHLAALHAADLVLVVGALSPLGLSDLLLQIRALAERLDLREFSPADRRAPGSDPPVWCVLNKGRGSLLRHGPARVTADTGVPVAATIPLDARNVLAAEEARLPLTVARPRSPAASVITRLATRLQRDLAHAPQPDGSDPEILRRFSGDSDG